MDLCEIAFSGMSRMPISENARAAAAIHRKLRSLSAVFLDPAATENEKANAERLKALLVDQLIGK